MAQQNNLQFDRRYRLQVGDYKTGNGVLITSEDTEFPLQITFEISKTSDVKHKGGNSAVIEIYNLTRDQEKLMDSRYLEAQFSVGYQNEEGLRLIATGNITDTTTVKRGTDTITQLKMGEGYTAFRETRIAQNLSPGQTVQDVIRVISDAMPGISRGPFVGTNLTNPLPYGWRINGTAKQELDRVCKAHDLEYSISNNILIVTGLNQPTSKSVVDVPVISVDTGMIEEPFRVTEQIKLGKKDKRKRYGVQVKCLLNPSFIVSSVVRIESEHITGYYRINALRYSGDYRGNAWYAELTCVEMTDVDITIIESK